MITKIILGVSFVAVATLIGLKLCEKQKTKRNILSELVSFNNSFMCDVGLYNYSVIEKLHGASEILQKTFLGSVESLREGKAFVCLDTRLNQGERLLVEEYVNGLGKGDSSAQKESLKLYDEKFKSLNAVQEANVSKCAKLYVKLGFSFGLLVVVILM